jgi:two-component system cell cycle response regulator DivK
MSRCLIVDDHLDGRDGFQEYLESYGMDVAAAGSAEDALRLAGQQVFDVMIVDLQLPEMNGWDYIRAVRRDPSTWDVPIIAVSGCVFPEDRTRAAEAGCDLFLAKPCGPDDLLSAVRELLERARTAKSQ